MVLNPTQGSTTEKTPVAAGKDRPRFASEVPAEIIWHDLECGSYRADLPLWRDLAKRHGGRILDVGAGTGRVTLDLAQAGHRVTALDLDPDLLGALRERAIDLEVETVCADARSFDLDRHDFALCLVPMQTLQLLGGTAERARFLRCARVHLRPGGMLACAIVTELEPFDTADSPGPSPETARIGENIYTSRATSVRVLPLGIVIERSRRIVSSTTRAAREQCSAATRTDDPAAERNVIELAGFSTSQLEREGAEVGFHPEPALAIEPTDEHVGSVVVMLRA